MTIKNKKIGTSLLFFFLLLAIIFMKSGLFDRDDTSLLFFYLLLVILFCNFYSI